MKTTFSILPNSEIDKRKWDELHSRHSFNQVYSKSWYLDALRPDWSAIIDNSFSIALPVIIGQRLGQKFIYQPLYANQFEILHRLSEDKTSCRELLRHLLPYCKHIHLQLRTVPEGLPKKLRVRIHNYQILDFKNLQTLSYKKGLRHSLNKSQKLGVQIESKLSEETFHDFVFNSDLYRQIKCYRKGHASLMRLIEVAKIQSQVDLWGARSSSGKLLSAAACICDHNRYYIIMQCSSSEGKRACASHLLTHHIINRAKGISEILDFVGSRIPGVSFFNKQFGAEDASYTSLTKGSNSIIGHLRKLNNYFEDMSNP